MRTYKAYLRPLNNILICPISASKSDFNLPSNFCDLILKIIFVWVPDPMNFYRDG
jgi:hypothetical protein